MSAGANGDGAPPTEDRIAALVARAAARRAAAAARRQRLQAAREHGLLARHRLKLAYLANRETPGVGRQDLTDPACPGSDGGAA